MTQDKLEIGGIYKTDFDSRPFRIIGLDQYEVFYDCLWSDNKWTFSGSFRRKTIFYRMSAKIFQSKSELIEVNKLTDEEFKYFRPDLPMRFGRIKDISWNNLDSVFDDYKDQITDFKIDTEKLVLVPHGKKGGYGKGVIIEQTGGLMGLEIISQASKIQNSVNDCQSDGIGFYRLGFEKGLPRYSIGEYLDKAGLMKN
ncbi:hypothetical protein [Marinifilum flexuosum]|uniref:hypothetical protein n=1 Tax=Marinifilum flexuosum TaxID=1117708 RepID=UPI002494F9DE|nr:hypothetical protein [Marinifilum flexuosum]